MLSDKYFQQNNAKRTITLCDDTILIDGIQFSAEGLIEAIDILEAEVSKINKFNQPAEYARLRTRLVQFVKIAVQNNLTVNIEFRTK